MSDTIYKVNRNYYQNESVVRDIKKRHPEYKIYKASNITWEEVRL